MSGLFDSHIEITAKVLDLRLERQNVVMSNIANVNTPDYKPVRLEFEKELQGALNMDMNGKMARTEQGHMPSKFDAATFEGEEEHPFEPRYVYGQDTVDMDKEVTRMAKNAMMYNALTQVIGKSFTGLEKVISEGKQ
ncbi:MAG: flagellar basal-body rod protein FlgB [Desulfovibrionales bacterium]|nr:flagellar basal-body rod protein FlgB [Desulfovibrionales bacterium]